MHVAALPGCVSGRVCHDDFVPEGDVSDAELALLLAEHDSLRDEAFHRMDHRVTLLTTSLVVDAAVIGVGIERDSPELLLLVPLIACLFGLLVTYHHRAIAELGDFIREEIDARVMVRYPGIRRWHSTRSDWRPLEILLVWHVPIVAATLLPSVVAVGLAMEHPPTPGRELLLFADAGAVIAYVFTYATTIARARREP